MIENLDQALVTQTPGQQVGKNLHKYNQNTLIATYSNHLICLFCDARDHYLSKCSRFLNLSPNLRYREAKKLHLCLNCLRKGHSLQQCKSTHSKYCRMKHHSLLHMNHDTSATSTSFSSPSCDPASSSQPLPSTSSALVSCSLTSSHPDHHLLSPPPKTLNILPIDYVLLPTAIIYVRNRIGAFMPCRAILDSASQLNFITFA